MDARGFTWTNTFVHARPGMNKKPDAFGVTIYHKEATRGVLGCLSGLIRREKPMGSWLKVVDFFRYYLLLFILN